MSMNEKNNQNQEVLHQASELKTCKHCGSEIPKKAKVCPHCRKKQSGKVKFIVIGVIVLFFIIIMSSGENSDTPTQNLDNATITQAPEITTQELDETKETVDEKEVDETDTKENDESSGEKLNTGTFIPLDLYDALQDNGSYPYTMGEKASKFLADNPNLFPVKKVNKLEKYVDYDIAYKHLAKNPSKYGDKVMCLSEGYVIDCSEENLDEDTMFTSLHIMDADGNNFIILYMGELDIFEEDVVVCYGLPLGVTSFSNISGGTTLAGVLAGCYVNKIE